MKLKRTYVAPVYFRHGMIEHVWARSLAGYTEDSQIAESLAARFDPNITTEHVKRWRREHREFQRACGYALETLEAEAVNEVARSIREGDVATAKWFLERRNSTFKPSTKVDFNARVDSLDSLLEKRAQYSDEALIEAGVISSVDD